MKIINNTIPEDVVNDTSKAMSIATTPASFMLMLENLYQDPLGAVLREITTNAVDIHKSVGSDKKVLIQLPNNECSDLIIRDYGTGLNAHDIDFYLNRIFSTNKSSDDLSMGGYGLGSKSPLAVVDYFEIISFHQGTAYLCTWDKKPGQLPRFDIINQDQTDQPNGMVFRIPLGDSKKIDQRYLTSIVREKANKELCTFISDVIFVKDALVSYDSIINITSEIITSIPIYEDLNYSIYKEINLSSATHTISTYSSSRYNFDVRVQIGNVNYTCSNNTNSISQALNEVLYFSGPEKITVYIKIPIGVLEIPMSREIISNTSKNDEIINKYVATITKDICNLKSKVVTDVGFIEYLKNKIEIDSSVFKHTQVSFKDIPTIFEQEVRELTNSCSPYLNLSQIRFLNETTDPNSYYGSYYRFHIYDYQHYVLGLLDSFLNYFGFKYYKENNSSATLDSAGSYELSLTDLVIKQPLNYPGVSNKVVLSYYKDTYQKSVLGYFQNFNPEGLNLELFESLVFASFALRGKESSVQFVDSAASIEEIKEYRKLNKISTRSTTSVSFKGVHYVDSTMTDNLSTLNISHGPTYCSHLSSNVKQLFKIQNENGQILPLGPCYFEDPSRPLLLVNREDLSIPIDFKDYPLIRFKGYSFRKYLRSCNILIISSGVIDRYKSILDSQGIVYYCSDNKYLPPRTDEILLLDLLEQNPEESLGWFKIVFSGLSNIFGYRANLTENVEQIVVEFLNTLIQDENNERYLPYLKSYILSLSNTSASLQNSNANQLDQVHYISKETVDEVNTFIFDKFQEYFNSNLEDFIKSNFDALLNNSLFNKKFIISYIKDKLEIPRIVES